MDLTPKRRRRRHHYERKWKGNEIKFRVSKMRDHRFFLAVTETTAQHSHSRFVLLSVIETMFFMAITGYQIHTIRKWFSAGEPKLGQ